MKAFSIIIAIVACLISVPESAQAQRTTRRSLHAVSAVDTSAIALQPLDTVTAPQDLVSVTGYEKPLRSRRETMHVTNLDTIRPLRALSIDIEYLDIDSIQLHRRRVDLQCDIPPGETRMLSFRSWDLQNRFYYYGGPAPRSVAYPFTIIIDILSAAYLPATNNTSGN